MNNKIKQYQQFRYLSYDYYYKEHQLFIDYSFEIVGLDTFNCHYQLPVKHILKESFELDTLIFYLGLVESLSVYKLTVAKQFDIACYSLSTDEQSFFEKLMEYGLGEFYYTNNLDYKKLKPIISSSGMNKNFPSTDLPCSGFLIPVGGGKDSVVTIELLKQFDSSLFILNELPSAKACADVSGLTCLSVSRIYDPKIVKYNKEGFYNGHTPFSAMLSFITTITAFLNGKQYIMLSNENSANESTVHDVYVNHQYSKSFEYEQDFRMLLHKQLPNLKIQCLSFLRPLSELQISMLFARMKQYHKIFTSCNRGSKLGIWCGECAKCLFVYIMLSAFLDEKELIDIFKEDLFMKDSLYQEFMELIGETEHKPFECVGTVDEINQALLMALNKQTSRKLLSAYLQSKAYQQYRDYPFDLKNISTQHFLSPDQLKLIEREL